MLLTFEFRMKPQLSHTQYAILGLIGSSVMPGIELREELASNGFNMSPATFSHTMGNLERMGFVTAEHTVKHVSGRTFRGKNFEVTAAGQKAFEETIEFYRRLGSNQHPLRTGP